MTDITVIGTGYVGLVAAIGLSDFGNRVVGADIDPEKIERLKKGIPPIYEPGIEEYLRRNLESGRLSFTTEVEVAVRGSDVVFLAVGTPPSEDGSADLSYLFNAADTIADNAKGYTVVVTKSTVPVGTNRALEDRIRARNPEADVDVVSNPEFLREGKAVQDFFHPDRTVVGTESERAKEMIRTIYRALNLISVPFVWCNRETAELIKYASNAFLATKITFINQMANLADAVGADIHAVAKTMGMDGRISPKFLHPGPGYGGSCFPKDTKAIASTGDEVGVDMSLIKAVIDANEYQKKRVARVLEQMTGSLSGLTVAILGLAFKAETDDVRDSPALTVVGELLASGATVRAHDPQAAENFQRLLPDTQCFSTSYEAVEGADAVVLMTEWNEYRSLDLDTLTEKMKGRVVLDARNLLDPAMVRDAGFTYRGTGRGV
jgi:UDPglucose 6-dehydrogenase